MRCRVAVIEIRHKPALHAFRKQNGVSPEMGLLVVAIVFILHAEWAEGDVALSGAVLVSLLPEQHFALGVVGFDAILQATEVLTHIRRITAAHFPSTQKGFGSYFDFTPRLGKRLRRSFMRAVGRTKKPAEAGESRRKYRVCCSEYGSRQAMSP